MNYFELFSLPVSFEVDLTELSGKYRELQRAVHPDKFANASERERLLAVQKAAEINDAFDTMKSAVSRAEYLLMLAGIELAHEHQTLKDPIFLMQQMELREQLEEISGTSDPEEAITAFQRQIEQFITQLQQELTSFFNDGSSSAHQQAADCVRKLKFMLKLSQEAQLLEEQFFTF